MSGKLSRVVSGRVQAFFDFQVVFRVFVRHLKLMLESKQDRLADFSSNHLRLMRGCLANIHEFPSGTCPSSDEHLVFIRPILTPLRPCGGVVSRGARLREGAHALMQRGGACLSAAARRRMDVPRCMSLRAKATRRWWRSCWRQGRPHTQQTR